MIYPLNAYYAAADVYIGLGEGGSGHLRPHNIRSKGVSYIYIRLGEGGRVTCGRAEQLNGFDDAHQTSPSLRDACGPREAST